ncbi:MAG: altronate dehydratase family protein [Treponema sp.]|jgi:altronate hydrolase|nr:altronate dehydratase family protein [Treponema sp.]
MEKMESSKAAKIIRIHALDTVAVALKPLEKGEIAANEDATGGDFAGAPLVCVDDIPGGHKIALKDIEQGEKIVKYGHPIGKASQFIPAGAHVHTHNIQTLLAETPEYHWTPPQIASRQGAGAKALMDSNASDALASPAAPEIKVFKRRDGRIGVRNEVWIVPTVGCVNGAAETLASWASREYADRNIGGVFAWTHPYGCSQMGGDHEATRAILADLVKHPNAGAVLVISLGCENNTIGRFKEALDEYAEDPRRIRFLVTQESEDEIADGKAMIRELVSYAEQAKREKTPVSSLVVGMKCGGSDGFSGITANALVGRLCDMLTGMGASVILTETPEMFGAERMLMDRCETKEVFDKTVRLINGFKEYFRSHNQTVYENPSPGNKAGGISTLEDKSCGCVQKGGSAIVRGVYRYGERLPPDAEGLVLLEGPGNDIVSTTAMTAAGAHLILFTTGRGAPLGAPVPTLKIASNSALARKKPAWIDFDAGRMLSEPVNAVRDELFHLLLDTVNGTIVTRNELNNYREIAIFKNGVTL